MSREIFALILLVIHSLEDTHWRMSKNVNMKQNVARTKQSFYRSVTANIIVVTHAGYIIMFEDFPSPTNTHEMKHVHVNDISLLVNTYLMIIRTAMNMEQIGSAIIQPNACISVEDMITPTLPRVSAKM